MALEQLGRWLDLHHVHRGLPALVALALLAVALEVAAATGMSYVAGFPAVGRVFADLDWLWLPIAVGVAFAGFVGYWATYRAIFRARSGRALRLGSMTAVAVAGFGGFLSHGSAIDLGALQAAGAHDRDSRVRLWAMSGLEQGVLALAACAASILVLVNGRSVPNASYTLPWAIVPLPGFVLAFLLARRYAGRLRGGKGWRGYVGVFLDCIELVRHLFSRAAGRDAAVGGMALFWAGEAAATWCALDAVGARLPVAALIVAFATGMLATRRSVPLGGAGLVMLVMPLTLWGCGVPLPAAVAGVFIYRVVTMWLPLPAAFAGRPALRRVLAQTDEPAAPAAGVTG